MRPRRRPLRLRGGRPMGACRGPLRLRGGRPKWARLVLAASAAAHLLAAVDVERRDKQREPLEPQRRLLVVVARHRATLDLVVPLLRERPRRRCRHTG
eukprot:6605493-Prymnesium_polylepis.1